MRTPRDPSPLRRAPLRRRELFAALSIALSGLLLAACPRNERPKAPPPAGGSMPRRY
jgi:hypothetical protein